MCKIVSSLCATKVHITELIKNYMVSYNESVETVKSLNLSLILSPKDYDYCVPAPSTIGAAQKYTS